MTDSALDFLRRTDDGRIVSSGDLTNLQIAEAQADGRFFVDSDTGYGWAIIPWDLSTPKDRMRETNFFQKKKQDSEQ